MISKVSRPALANGYKLIRVDLCGIVPHQGYPIKCSVLAQLVEQVTVNHRVAGSSPADGAKYNAHVAVREGLGLSIREGGFESRRGRQYLAH